VIRAVWVAAGVSVLVYLALSFSAWGVGDSVLRSDDAVTVVETDRAIDIAPARKDSGAALLFFPGGLVHPDAYAPLLRMVAESGHRAVLVKLPSLGGRHAAGAEGRREAVRRGLEIIGNDPARSWVVAGHSLGGAIAALLAAEAPPGVRGLALIATTHPRDHSLTGFPHPVMKIYGTRDGVAPLDRMRSNAHRLPEGTEWLAIEGGNHSRFGYYGFQLGDRRATISRAEQQAATGAALLRLLRTIGAA
jgi:pimeloyl-ACP methyl ester carboxylesterase